MQLEDVSQGGMSSETGNTREDGTPPPNGEIRDLGYPTPPPTNRASPSGGSGEELEPVIRLTSVITYSHRPSAGPGSGPGPGHPDSVGLTGESEFYLLDGGGDKGVYQCFREDSGPWQCDPNQDLYPLYPTLSEASFPTPLSSPGCCNSSTHFHYGAHAHGITPDDSQELKSHHNPSYEK
ncbi:unnamed protein product [Darwinula stevensoni]|uniref:Uncharacterized protein n=1 Tax=Darwinula stevensoni TaxID=69355 RepID=A0A7R8X753_9CRUS|nr:unnamed protein product [Darwinula stevensoni]CAG0886508.1 unnamed protein product [Darwinula stevensoni]